MTGTYDSAWKDKLLSWDGTAMTYDAIGNMLTGGGTTYTWTQGRRLSGVENGKSIKYLYDNIGARVKKTVDNTVTEYQWAGDLLLSEKTDGRIIWYCYDSQANLISVTIRGITYFYVRNVQGDIIALVDADGKVVVKYTYDSWGKVVAVTGELADTVGVQNPFRYKGYYYDNETGMYYLKSRYYDAEIKRFICMDKYFMTNRGMNKSNMLVYCENNPINRVDMFGTCWYDAKGNWRHDNWEYKGNYKRQPKPAGKPNINITYKLNKTMRNNAEELRNYRKENGYASAVGYFISKVKTGGDWDFKNQKSWNLNRDFSYTYKNETLRFDDIGNIHYGYVGRELFGVGMLVAGGGAYQIKTDYPNIQWNHFWSLFDDPQDQWMVIFGSTLWDADMDNSYYKF